jgi:hypothetical protein
MELQQIRPACVTEIRIGSLPLRVALGLALPRPAFAAQARASRIAVRKDTLRALRSLWSCAQKLPPAKEQAIAGEP